MTMSEPATADATGTQSTNLSVLGAFSPKKTKLNLLLLAVPITWYYAYF